MVDGRTMSELLGMAGLLESSLLTLARAIKATMAIGTTKMGCTCAAMRQPLARSGNGAS